MPSNTNEMLVKDITSQNSSFFSRRGFLGMHYLVSGFYLVTWVLVLWYDMHRYPSWQEIAPLMEYLRLAFPICQGLLFGCLFIWHILAGKILNDIGYSKRLQRWGMFWALIFVIGCIYWYYSEDRRFSSPARDFDMIYPVWLIILLFSSFSILAWDLSLLKGSRTAKGWIIGGLIWIFAINWPGLMETLSIYSLTFLGSMGWLCLGIGWILLLKVVSLPKE